MKIVYGIVEWWTPAPLPDRRAYRPEGRAGVHHSSPYFRILIKNLAML